MHTHIDHASATSYSRMLDFQVQHRQAPCPPPHTHKVQGRDLGGVTVPGDLRLTSFAMSSQIWAVGAGSSGPGTCRWTGNHRAYQSETMHTGILRVKYGMDLAKPSCKLLPVTSGRSNMKGRQRRQPTAFDIHNSSFVQMGAPD
jgi:hypothetical protein